MELKNKYLAIIIVFVAFTRGAFAQEWSSGLDFASPKIKPAFSLGVEFNAEDVNIPARFGAFDKQNMVTAGLEFGFRPSSKNIERPFSESVYLQLQERRFLFGTYVEKYLLPFQIAKTVRAGMMFGSTFGFEYTTMRGLSEAEVSGLIAPYAGLSAGFAGSFLVSAGYRHDPISRQISPHRFFLSLTGTLSDKN